MDWRQAGKINDKEQEELFRILESHNSSDSLEDDFSASSDSCYQSADDSSDSPNIQICFKTSSQVDPRTY